MNQFGCPYAKDPNSSRAGTGGPKPNSVFQGCDGKTYKRTADGGIPDEIGQDYPKISNRPRTLSMANTGQPQSGGSQFFINVRDNSFLDWFDTNTSSAHPVFGEVSPLYELNVSLLCQRYFQHVCSYVLLQVTEGYDLVERISKVPTRNDNPIEPIKMISIRVS